MVISLHEDFLQRVVVQGNRSLGILCNCHLFCSFVNYGTADAQKNLKGTPLELEDIRADAHYLVAGINQENKLCQLELRYPVTPALSVYMDFVLLEQATKDQGVSFEQGLVFGKRKDDTIFFLSPEKNKPSPQSSKGGEK